MNNLIENSLKKLKDIKVENPEQELRILLNHSSINKKIISLNKINPDEINLNLFNNLFLERLKRKPLSKIINRKYFWKSEFYVNTFVLDPRPETELIIEEALRIFKDKTKPLKILDIGTGSGCIAISLAKEFKNSKITAIDISSNALKVAKKNVILNNCQDQIHLQLIEFDKIKKKFDLIVSNPPYLTRSEYLNCEEEITRYEPKLALIGGKDGFLFYKKFADKIKLNMKKNSYFICEIGYTQLSKCKKIFDNSNLILKKISKDLQNIDRTLTFFKI